MSFESIAEEDSEEGEADVSGIYDDADHEQYNQVITGDNWHATFLLVQIDNHNVWQAINSHCFWSRHEDARAAQRQAEEFFYFLTLI